MIVEHQQFRGVHFLMNGQRCEEWLPPGEYQSGAVVNLTVGRGSEMIQARELFRIVPNGLKQKWYVAASAVPA